MTRQNRNDTWQRHHVLFCFVIAFVANTMKTDDPRAEQRAEFIEKLADEVEHRVDEGSL